MIKRGRRRAADLQEAGEALLHAAQGMVNEYVAPGNVQLELRDHRAARGTEIVWMSRSGGLLSDPQAQTLSMISPMT